MKTTVILFINMRQFSCNNLIRSCNGIHITQHRGELLWIGVSLKHLAQSSTLGAILNEIMPMVRGHNRCNKRRALAKLARLFFLND